MSRPAACMPRSSASMRTRQAAWVSMTAHTGAPTRPATSSSCSRTDGADAIELLLVDDAGELLAEVERLGAGRQDRRALRAERGGRFVVVRDGVQARESGIRGPTQDDRADRDLHRVQLPLEV